VTSFSTACYGSARMSRALCALAAVALLASGCASRRTVTQLESEVGRLRSELAELRVAQEVTARTLARVAPQIEALDARTSETQAGMRSLSDDITRLTRRTDAVDTTLGETRTRVETLATTPRPPPSPPSTTAPVERPRVPAVPPPALPAAPAPLAPLPRADDPEQEYTAALATFRSREHGQAVLDFIDFIAKHPKHALAGNAQYWIGEAYWAQRDYRQALVEFERVSEYGPGKAPDALVKIGLCHARLRDVTRAQRAWQRVIRDYPRSEAATVAQSLLKAQAAVRE
jgi:tol-pal system protein YbgF